MGISPRVGFSNSSAGPPARTVRVTTSLISSVGSTGTPTRRSSPAASSAARKSLRSVYGNPRAAMPTSLTYPAQTPP